MLFINFVCLLYLVVLNNGHTISKSIDKVSNLDEKSDSIINVDSPRRYHRFRPDRINLKDRRLDVTKPINSKVMREFFETTTSAAKDAIAKQKSESTKAKKKKKKAFSFWKKFKSKDKSYTTEEDKNKIGTISNHGTKRMDKEHHNPNRSFRRRNNKMFVFQNPVHAVKRNALEIETNKKPVHRWIVPKPEYYSSDKMIATPYIDDAAEVESLLNDIKYKIMHMTYSGHPSMKEAVTDSDDETHLIDPLLFHVTLTTPGYIETFMPSILYNPNLNKETGNLTEIETPFIETGPKLYKRDDNNNVNKGKNKTNKCHAYKWKKIYCKYKNKMEKGVTRISTTMRKYAQKISNKFKGQDCCKKCAKPKPAKAHAPAKPEASASILSNVVNFTHVDKRSITIEIDYTPLYDTDKTMASQDEMTLTTNPIKIRKDLNRLSKRNPETLTDIKLKEDVNKIFDDGITMPGYNDMTEVGVNSSTESYTGSTESEVSELTDMSLKRDINKIFEKYLNDMSGQTEQYTESVEEDRKTEYSTPNYTDVREKVLYDDYVNGYRYYLNFLKDFGAQNFSAMVKYQAHKHHSVDDIGKYILEKIPHVTTSQERARRFFEDTDTDDQEGSTKSDDSWFKRHFTFFLIDKVPAKSYKSSQATTPSDTSKNILLTTIKNVFDYEIGDAKLSPEAFDKVISKYRQDELSSEEINLDDLLKALKVLDKKYTSVSLENVTSTKSPSKKSSIIVIDDKMEEVNILDKLFGKNRRTAKNNAQKMKILDIFNRFKRTTGNVEKSDEEYNDKKANEEDIEDLDKVQESATKKRRDDPKRKSDRFFQKLHFKRNRQGADSNWLARFNPFERLKDAFRDPSSEVVSGSTTYHVRIYTEKGLVNHVDVPMPQEEDFKFDDAKYEQMVQRNIAKFKPKYDYDVKIVELRNQVPNISESDPMKSFGDEGFDQGINYFSNNDVSSESTRYCNHTVTFENAYKAFAKVTSSMFGETTSYDTKKTTYNPNKFVFTQQMEKYDTPATTVPKARYEKPNTIKHGDLVKFGTKDFKSATQSSKINLFEKGLKKIEKNVEVNNKTGVQDYARPTRNRDYDYVSEKTRRSNDRQPDDVKYKIETILMSHPSVPSKRGGMQMLLRDEFKNNVVRIKGVTRSDKTNAYDTMVSRKIKQKPRRQKPEAKSRVYRPSAGDKGRVVAEESEYL